MCLDIYAFCYNKIISYRANPTKNENNFDTPKIEKYITFDHKLCIKYKIPFGWCCMNIYHYLAGSFWNYPRYLDFDKLLIEIFQKTTDSIEKQKVAIKIIISWFKFMKKVRYYKGHRARLALLRCLLN